MRPGARTARYETTRQPSGTLAATGRPSTIVIEQLDRLLERPRGIYLRSRFQLEVLGTNGRGFRLIGWARCSHHGAEFTIDTDNEVDSMTVPLGISPRDLVSTSRSPIMFPVFGSTMISGWESRLGSCRPSATPI